MIFSSSMLLPPPKSLFMVLNGMVNFLNILTNLLWSTCPMVLCLLSSFSLSLFSPSSLATVGKNGNFIKWGRPALMMLLSWSSLACPMLKNGNLIKCGRRRCWTIGLKNGAAGPMISTIVGFRRLWILCWHMDPVKPCKHRHILRPTHCPPFWQGCSHAEINRVDNFLKKGELGYSL